MYLGSLRLASTVGQVSNTYRVSTWISILKPGRSKGGANAFPLCLTVKKATPFYSSLYPFSIHTEMRERHLGLLSYLSKPV